MTFNAANPDQVKNRKRRERRARERKASDMRFVMSSKEGRRFVYGLLVDCGIYKSSFTVVNGLSVAFNEGTRNVGLKLLASLQEVCLEEFHLAETEAAFHDKREDEAQEALEATTEPEEENDNA